MSVRGRGVQKTGVQKFGEHEGETVHRVALRGSDGVEAAVIGFGASLQDLRVPMPEGPRRVTLGFETLEAYVAHGAFFGAVVGRYGNRIGRGRLPIAGRVHQLDLNENGRHHLHGGSRGFGVRAWRLVDHGLDHCAFELVSPDGDMGYPGRVTARATYRLAPGGLTIALEATTDAPTALNLVAHPYFNLAGTGDIGGHRLRIAAERVLEVDADLIPTGAFKPVAGTHRDFRVQRTIDAIPGGLDDCFVVEPGGAGAVLASPRGDLSMTVSSDRPGLQVYDGRHIPGARGLGGVAYGPRSGLCLEAQGFPDAPNHEGFPSAVLRPGEVFSARVAYRFKAGE